MLDFRLSMGTMEAYLEEAMAHLILDLQDPISLEVWEDKNNL